MIANLKPSMPRSRTAHGSYRFRTIRAAGILVLIAGHSLEVPQVHAFSVADASQAFGLGVLRWETEPHFVDGVERSLVGGLRYSVQGGSFATLRDALPWDGTSPSVEEFQQAVEQAFAIWETVDPSTGLGTALRFVPDLTTTAVLEPIPDEISGYLQLNRGAEIDIFAAALPGGTIGRADSWADPDASTVTLTSGVINYPAAVMSGVDIRIDTEENWTLDRFVNTLGHEIGHAIGLADVDFDSVVDGQGVFSLFYDDNFDGSRQSTALATLTNSFANLIDPLDPDHSPGLREYRICTAPDSGDPYDCKSNPGLDTPGVDIFMESSASPGMRPPGPQNDDFAGRQFLYPFVRVPGDFDGDSTRSAADIDLLSAEIDTESPRLWFDLNDDDVLSQDDRAAWVHVLENTYFGDADLDGEFNSDDLNTIAAAATYEQDIAAGWAAGDFSGDGRFNAQDLIFAAADLGYEQGPRTVTAAVPEPASAAGLLIGAATLMFALRGRC